MTNTLKQGDKKYLGLGLGLVKTIGIIIIPRVRVRVTKTIEIIILPRVRVRVRVSENYRNNNNT